MQPQKKPSREESIVYQYLRPKKKFPNIWCAGCGIGIVMGAIIRAIVRLKLPKDEVAVISGIGCTGRMPVYMDFNTMHTTHGRALAFATGLKMARPELTVIVVMGDGDALAIGGNHFIHACRRNIDLTAVVINNRIYGMTGGQVAPTTPMGAFSATTPYGNIEQPFPVCELAKAAGASFVARSTVYHSPELSKFIEKAIVKKGFSVVEAVSYCHTNYGRFNDMRSPVKMMHYLKEHSLPKHAYEKLPPAERADKILRGIIYDAEEEGTPRVEYLEAYERIIAQARKGTG